MRKINSLVLFILIVCLTNCVAIAEETSPSILFNDKVFGQTTYIEISNTCSSNAQKGTKILDIIKYADYDYSIEYGFTNDVLTSVYLYTEAFSDADECEDKYNKLNMEMMEAYGIPKSMDDSWGFYAWKPMYENQMNTAMYKGYVSRITQFDVSGYTIKIEIAPMENSKIVRLSATIKKNSNIQFILDTFRNKNDISVSADSVSGDVYIQYTESVPFRFTDKYSQNYYSNIYPDIFCTTKDGVLYPLFRIWIQYRSTDSLYIDDIHIRMGDTTWSFSNAGLDTPKTIEDNKPAYETLEKALVRFDVESIEFLEELLKYEGEITVRMTSDISTEQRDFLMPAGTINAIKELYQMFKDANGTDTDLLSFYNGNSCVKKQITVY